MLGRILPKQIDNSYRGHWLALWLFSMFLLLKLAMSVNSIVNTRSVAEGADGIPLDSYGAGGAEAVLLLFAVHAYSQLVLILLGVLVLIRYRAMIPLMFLLLLVETVGRRAIIFANPIDRIGGENPVGLYINLGLLGLLIAGLILSMQHRSGTEK